MCGIAGLWQLSGGPGEDLPAQARAMANALSHRGPDDSGVWFDSRAGLAISHRRLSIIDLSPQGRQPMHSADKRYCVVLNGEIYNFTELREELERAARAPAWRGHSDTEVMLAEISAYGIEAALRRLVGMFALALWDAHDQVLHLARDRIGEKPLYYGWAGGTFVFGSELKALRAHREFETRVNREALALYARYGYVPAPWSIYGEVRKLPPGALLSLRAAQIHSRQLPDPQRYWSLADAVRKGRERPFRSGPQEAAEALEGILLQSVKQQMIADVPLGAFLSSGVDSPTVVALMQAASSKPVKTFSVGFRDREFNEAEYAKSIAAHLGTDHTELYVEPGEALGVIPRLPAIYDEPFADSSQIPTLLVSRLARRHVTVSLSGDGGDELFAGYNHYAWGQRISTIAGAMPQFLRSLSAGALSALSTGLWTLHSANRVQKLARAIGAGNQDELYEALVTYWDQPNPVIGATAIPHAAGAAERIGGLRPPERMMYLDALTYLPDDILVKVDRAAMSVGLESRMPLLDHRVVEFAWRLPLAMKLRNGERKWLLRSILQNHVPRALTTRRKMGFSIPLADWLRGPLRDWAETILNPNRLSREGWFDPSLVQRIWQEHLSGRANRQNLLWVVLMFGAWLESENRAPHSELARAQA